MSEENNEMFGRLDVSPDKGLNLSMIDIKDVRKGETVVVFVKDTTSAFKIVKGLYKVDYDEKDNMKLVPIQDELGDEKVRKALAHALVEMNRDAIMEQALIVSEKALSRKPVKQLKRLFKQKMSGKKLELKTKVGCVFLCIGDEETIL